MKLALNVYTDDCLTEIKRVAEADRLKIPYRVSLYVAQSLDDMDLKDKDKVFDYLIKNLDKVDKIIKATFGLSETEMECIDLMEMVTMAAELYKWAIEKFGSLKEENEKNAVMTA